MPKKHCLGDKLPDEYERHRARFLGMTLLEFKRHQGYLRWMRSRFGKPSPSDERSQKPPVKRSSGTTMLPYDQSEIGRRRAKAAIEYVAEVGRQAGLEAQKQIRQARQREGLSVPPEDDPRQEP